MSTFTTRYRGNKRQGSRTWSWNLGGTDFRRGLSWDGDTTTLQFWLNGAECAAGQFRDTLEAALLEHPPERIMFRNISAAALGALDDTAR